MIYPDEWHRRFGEVTFHSAQSILKPIAEILPLTSMAEVGCGNGHWTKAGVDLGVTDYVVVDGPWNNPDDLVVDKSRFVEADLAVPLRLDRRYDLALCLEVAEHVRTESAPTLVASLAAAADVVLFGAAIPLQGGFGHINEQWQSWWRDHFAKLGYRAFDVIRPAHWTDSGIHYWYRQNCMLFVSDAAPEKQEAVRDYRRRNIDNWDMLDAIHPEKFLEIARYEQVCMPLLMPKLPGHLIARVKQRLKL